MEPNNKTEKKVKDIIKLTKKDIKLIKQLRELGASDKEIARGLGIPEDSLLLKG